MRVKSTGLGRTQLTANFDGFRPKEDGEPSAVLVITSTKPVHWHIECDLGGSDLREFAGQVLRPGMIWHLLKLLIRGGDATGFVMEETEGRRGRGRSKAARRKKEEADSPRPNGAEPDTVRADDAGDDDGDAAEQYVSEEKAAAQTAVEPAERPSPERPSRKRPAVSSIEKMRSGHEEREEQRRERRRRREEAARAYRDPTATPQEQQVEHT